MTRRRKDPLRALTEEERDVLEQIARAHSEPASHVARAKSLLAVADGKTYANAAKPLDAVRVMPSPNWCPASTKKGWLPLNLGTGVAHSPSTVLLNRNEFWPKLAVLQIGNKMEQRLGRWQRCSKPYSTPPMVCRKSVFLQFG